MCKYASAGVIEYYFVTWGGFKFAATDWRRRSVNTVHPAAVFAEILFRNVINAFNIYAVNAVGCVNINIVFIAGSF